MREARRQRRDIVLFDTAGRQTVDDVLMQELFDIKKKVKPKNILLVADAMIGQDAVTTAGEFHKRLDLSGVMVCEARTQYPNLQFETGDARDRVVVGEEDTRSSFDTMVENLNKVVETHTPK